MPASNRPTALSAAPAPNLSGDILGTGVPSSAMQSSKITVALYGKNGVGKTTLACQGEGPMALLAIDPSPTGGARSMARPDVVVYQAASTFLKGRDGKLETVKGSEKVMAVIRAIKARFERGETPFRKVVVDGVTSWNDIILGEVLNTDWESMPAILGLGKVTGDDYTERSERLVRYLKPILDLPCDVWILAQERDHNAKMERTTTKSGKTYMRPAQTRLMQEAHPGNHQESFWSLALGDAQALYVQNSCDFILQLYEGDEYKEERMQDVPLTDGTFVPGAARLVATGQRVKRLRCKYHSNYASRCRASDYRAVPEYIEAPSPEERYAAFLDVVAGRRTMHGRYSDDE